MPAAAPAGAEDKTMEMLVVSLIVAGVVFLGARTLFGASGGCGCSGGGSGKESCCKEEDHEH